MSIQFKIFFAIILLFFLSSTSFSAELEFHGYMRAGVGTNNKGGEQTCFNSPALGSHLRVGNECTNYGELIFKANHLKSKSEGFMYTQFRLAFSQDGRKNFENTSGDNINIVEAYVEGGEFDNIALTFWAGKRFYRDNDVWMDDYYYFSQMNSSGFGIGNVSFLSGKLELSYLKNLSEAVETRNGYQEMAFFDMRLKEIKLNKTNELKFWLAFGHAPSDESLDGSEVYAKQDGFAVGTMWQKDIAGGFNQLALVYGQGTMNGLSVWGDVTQLKDDIDSFQENRKQYFALNHTTLKISNDLELHAALYFGVKENLDGKDINTNWYAIGITPVYYFSDHYQIMFQLGTSESKQDSVDSKKLSRITIAPQISASRSIWGRPVIRFFYSMSFWNDAMRDDISHPYKQNSEGSNFGFQAESWF